MENASGRERSGRGFEPGERPVQRLLVLGVLGCVETEPVEGLPCARLGGASSIHVDVFRRLCDVGIAFKDLNTRQSSLEDIFVSLVSDRT